MLISLSIRDFAVISSSELEFASGMTVISGETGAGKSLLVDALGFLSGARADSGMVRHGADRAELSASFSLSDANLATAWLKRQDMDDGDECLIRRVLRADGGSKAWINGRSATLGQLSEIASLLVEIHGQHAQQRLLVKADQLSMLDELGDYQTVRDTVSAHASAWRSAHKALDALTSNGDVEYRKQTLAESLNELDDAVLEPEAQEVLFARHKRMSHSAELIEACHDIAVDLEGDESRAGLLANLHRVKSELTKVSRFEPKLAEIAQLLDTAAIHTEEAAQNLAVIRDDVALDPQAMAQAERDMSRLQDLARKYRTRPELLLETRNALAEELDSLANAETTQRELEIALETHASAWQAAAAELSKARTGIARQLSERISGLMATLGMEGGQFEVAIEPTGTAPPDPLGAERIEFLVSANPGQPLRPLRRVASGGELSRIALAIQVAAIDGDIAPTMVFDEVDSGIGGAVADVVGGLLSTLSARCQVMCVTHLPQVAAHGAHHYRVNKSKSEGLTQSALEILNEDARIDELARMLGGSKKTAAVHAAAKALRNEAMSA